MKKPDPELPQNVEAERAVLGAILLGQQALYTAAEILRPEDFLLEAHRRIFSAALALEQEGVVPDSVTLTERLGANGDLKAAGGASYLALLLDGVPRVSNVEHYARLVKEKAHLRTLIRESSQLTEAALGAGASADELLGRWDSAIGALWEERLARGKGAMPLKEAVEEALPALERVGQGRGVILGTPTGFADFDRRMAGWVSGELVVLAARPSEGKTALAMEFLRRQAEMGNVSVIFSLEMGRASLVMRLACREARVDSHRLRAGYLSREEWGRLSIALERISRFPIWVDDRPIFWAHELRWRLRSLAQRHRLKLAVVDYLQLVRARGENRTQQVTEISLQLKAAARELGEISGGTLLAVSQLSRLPKEERPQLHHLRESGQIEQDADTVLLISDDEPAEIGQSDPWVKRVEIAKQRNGPTGLVKLVFLPCWMGYEPVAPIYKPVEGE